MSKQKELDAEIKLGTPLLKPKERLDLVKEHSIKTAETEG